jgi:hypothetical protein
MTAPMAENCLLSLYSCAPREALRDFTAPVWICPPRVRVDRLWNGRRLPPEARQAGTFTAASRWSADALYFCFDCRFDRLEVNSDWELGGPVDRLWDFDVVEVFLRPPGGPEYLEVEVSPLGQWLDLKVIVPRREVDWNWRSGLWSQVRVEGVHHRWLTVMELPWSRLSDLGRGARVPPATGDAWRVNLLRCARGAEGRLHVSWRPTFTPEPDFHVPDAFGHLLFVDREPLP